MPRRPRTRQHKPVASPEDPEVEVQDQPEEEEPVPSAPESEEEPEKPRGKKKGRRGRGANVEFRVSGDASSVRDAVSNYSEREEPKPQEEQPSDDDRKIIEALSSARNYVLVRRLYPRRWEGRRADRRLERYPCPIPKEDIEEDTCQRFGGKRFLATVHPNTPNGESKTLADFYFENPDVDDPWFPEDAGEPSPMETGEDPTTQEVDDPMAQAEHAINKQLQMQTKISQLRSLKQTLREMRSDTDSETGERKSKQELDRIQALEDRFGLSQVERQMDAKIGKLESALEKLIEQQMTQAKQPSGGGESSVMPLVLQMMKSSDQKFESMMTMMTATMNARRNEPKEDPLDKLVKLKSLLGKDDGKHSKIEEMLMQIAMDRLNGGDTDTEESDVKYAVKELAPIARTYIDKKLTGTQAPQGPTKEEFQKAVKDEAMKITHKTLGDLQKKGYLLRPPQTSDKAGIPHDPKKKVGAPEGGPKPRKEDRPQPQEQGEEPEVEVQETQERGEGNEVKTPPSPMSPAYDRSKAVNFVLDTILSEIDDCPDDSYVPGDIMDRLDDELLDQFLTISSGDELKEMIRPYADKEKIAEIERKGEEKEIRKSWLTRMVTTAQYEIRKEWDQAGGQEGEQDS